MARMKPPSIPQQPVPVPSTKDIRAILKGCEGNAFEDRRDAAIIRLFAALESASPSLPTSSWTARTAPTLIWTPASSASWGRAGGSVRRASGAARPRRSTATSVHVLSNPTAISHGSGSGVAAA